MNHRQIGAGLVIFGLCAGLVVACAEMAGDAEPMAQTPPVFTQANEEKAANAAVDAPPRAAAGKASPVTTKSKAKPEPSTGSTLVPAADQRKPGDVDDLLGNLEGVRPASPPPPPPPGWADNGRGEGERIARDEAEQRAAESHRSSRMARRRAQEEATRRGHLAGLERARAEDAPMPVEEEVEEESEIFADDNMDGDGVDEPTDVSGRMMYKPAPGRFGGEEGRRAPKKALIVADKTLADEQPPADPGDFHWNAKEQQGEDRWRNKRTARPQRSKDGKKADKKKKELRVKGRPAQLAQNPMASDDDYDEAYNSGYLDLGQHTIDLPDSESGGQGQRPYRGARRVRHQSVEQRLAQGPALFSDPGKPASFLPRVCYFENTYLGGNAQFSEQLRRLNQRFESEMPGHSGPWPHELAALPPQGFDPPAEAGIQLTADLHTGHLAGPGRVFLQVGLKGSPRFGWRRPPLDVMAIIDAPLARQPELALSTIKGLMGRLGPTDRLGVILVQPHSARLLAEPRSIRDHRLTLLPLVEGALADTSNDRRAGVQQALALAGEALRKAAANQARVPGSQTVLVLTGAEPDHSARAAAEAAARGAHGLTVQGAVTSVVELGQGDARSQGHWWPVAQAGHGNYHIFTPGEVEAALDAELASLSRVVARLLRLNIKLTGEAHAVRILGSRVLGQQEVKAVKAREEATDRNLSRTLGVKADRGEDDDGIQTVIPYFYGGDDHVFLVELWVEGPGTVADISLKYKDMVNLSNATARTAVSLEATPRRATPSQIAVRRNVRAFQVAEQLTRASGLLVDHGAHRALGALARARALAVHPDDDAIISAFEGWIARRGQSPVIKEALALAGQRRQGVSAPVR